MLLLGGFRVARLGQGLASAVCGRLFGDAGAMVDATREPHDTPLDHYLTRGTTLADRATAPGYLVCKPNFARLW